MDAGLYVTFFTTGERFENELPAVGPFEYLVMHQKSLVANRMSVSHVEQFGGGRWMEAELELQRALGNEPGGPHHADLRIVAPQGVYLRFASFDNSLEDEPAPELGPYAVVAVIKQGVEADGDLLAIRSGPDHRLWKLTDAGGSALAGLVRPDIAFRTKSTNYHPWIHPARPRVRSATPFSTALSPAAPPVEPKHDPLVEKGRFDPHVAPDARRSVEVPTALVHPAMTADDRRSTPEPSASLRSRLGGDVLSRQTPRTDKGDVDGRAANRRVMLFVVGALVIGLVAFGALRTSPSSDSASVVGIGKPVRGPHWDYTVATVSRASQVSTAVARGVYLIIWVTATNRDAPIASLSPRDFAIADGSGVQYAPVTASDPVYRSDSNPGSPLTWMTSYAVGQPVSTPVIFDVNPTLRGVQLMILEVPTVRVRLD